MTRPTLKARYEKLVSDRKPYLDRARWAAKLTVPSLLPPEGHNPTGTFETPWQSVGARGLNNLASKMQLALFPPGSPFFKITVDEALVQGLSDETKGDIEKALSKYERAVMSDFEGSLARPVLFNCMKHLIVAGNALLWQKPSGKVRLYDLTRYVCKRDADGNLYEVIACDKTAWGALSPEYRTVIEAVGKGAKTIDSDITIYTGARLEAGIWNVWQEVNGVPLPGTNVQYPNEGFPMVAVRFISVDGESYGRGFVEELYGDLNTVDALTESITQGAAASALVKFLINPNGVTSPDDLKDTPNTGFCYGREEDVSTLQTQKSGDLAVASQVLDRIESRLSYSFLLNSAVQRDAERVTAEEIRFMASELEDALGGIYSTLSQELQYPLVQARIYSMQSNGRLQALPKEVSKVVITTGLEALGRTHELQRLRTYVGDAAQTFGPEVISEYINVSEYMKRSAAALHVETEGLVREDEEVMQRRQQMAEMQAQAELQAQMAAAQPQSGGQ